MTQARIERVLENLAECLAVHGRHAFNMNLVFLINQLSDQASSGDEVTMRRHLRTLERLLEEKVEHQEALRDAGGTFPPADKTEHFAIEAGLDNWLRVVSETTGHVVAQKPLPDAFGAMLPCDYSNLAEVIVQTMYCGPFEHLPFMGVRFTADYMTGQEEKDHERQNENDRKFG